MKVNKDMLELFTDKTLFKDNYKMKCLKWHQRIRIFFKSWIMAFKFLPTILKEIKNG